MQQLTTLLSEPACRLIKPIEIDYNFTEMEDQCLFDIADKRFIKESGSLKGSPLTFIRYEYSESKKPNPVPFIEGTHFQSFYTFYTFPDSNQLISKLNEGPKCIYLQLSNYCHYQNLYHILSGHAWYHILSCLVTPYHTLSHLILRLETKPFSYANFKISSQAPKVLSHLIMPCHSLSHLILYGGKKLFSIGNFTISSQAPISLLHLITPCHILSHLITPYPLNRKQNHFHFTTLKLVLRSLISYHISSRIVNPYNITSYHTLSPTILGKIFGTK